MFQQAKKKIIKNRIKLNGTQMDFIVVVSHISQIAAKKL